MWSAKLIWFVCSAASARLQLTGNALPLSGSLETLLIEEDLRPGDART